jgi:uncharacterized protein (TIGR02246 family)
MRKILFALPALLLSHAAFAEPLIATIQKANDAFVADFAKGDAAAIAQLYTAKATALPPGGDIAKGRDAIQAVWAGAIKAGLKNVTITAVDVEPLGRAAAREIGRFSYEAPGQDGTLTKAEGKYVVVWKKAGAQWKLDTDIWNMNK